MGAARPGADRRDRAGAGAERLRGGDDLLRRPRPRGRRRRLPDRAAADVRRDPLPRPRPRSGGRGDDGRDRVRGLPRRGPCARLAAGVRADDRLRLELGLRARPGAGADRPGGSLRRSRRLRGRRRPQAGPRDLRAGARGRRAAGRRRPSTSATPTTTSPVPRPPGSRCCGSTATGPAETSRPSPSCPPRLRMARWWTIRRRERLRAASRAPALGAAAAVFARARPAAGHPAAAEAEAPQRARRLRGPARDRAGTG